MSHPAIDILFEDGPVLVVNKPPGLLTQAPRGIDSLEVQLKTFLDERDALGGEVYLGIIHRLDRPASGALVFAKERAAAQRLSRQFEQRRVGKSYWAFVEGDVQPAEGTWVDYVYKIHGMAKTEIVSADHPKAKHAVLHYRVLVTTERGTWLEIALETGRTHQIRVQSASRGHPVLGDALYGSADRFGVPYEDERRRAIALHARMLSFTHPVTREMVEIVAPISSGWGELDLPLECF